MTREQAIMSAKISALIGGRFIAETHPGSVFVFNKEHEIIEPDFEVLVSRLQLGVADCVDSNCAYCNAWD